MDLTPSYWSDKLQLKTIALLLRVAIVEEDFEHYNAYDICFRDLKELKALLPLHVNALAVPVNLENFVNFVQ